MPANPALFPAGAQTRVSGSLFDMWIRKRAGLVTHPPLGAPLRPGGRLFGRPMFRLPRRAEDAAARPGLAFIPIAMRLE
jgi:hypothetical protein